MINYRSDRGHLFRYDVPNVSSRILQGSIKVTTLEACRNAEKDYFRDEEEGTRTTTSLSGRDSLDAFGLAKLLGVDPGAIRVSGKDAVVTVSENAVHRRERLPNAFIFCASALVNDPSMKARFGAGCVKITAPIAFFELVDKHLRRAVAPNKLQMCVVDDVEYAPRTNNYRDHKDKHVAFLKPDGGQKTFEIECEVRAVWIPRDFDIKPVFLGIPAAAAFLEATRSGAT
jgi:hypothetical protein